jgi:hypothetical protein
MKGKDASWLAVFLCVVLVTMMIVIPHGGRGRLPTLDELEQDRKGIDCSTPIVGPLLCEIRRLLQALTGALELEDW